MKTNNNNNNNSNSNNNNKISIQNDCVSLEKLLSMKLLLIKIQLKKLKGKTDKNTIQIRKVKIDAKNYLYSINTN